MTPERRQRLIESRDHRSSSLPHLLSHPPNSEAAVCPYKHPSISQTLASNPFRYRLMNMSGDKSTQDFIKAVNGDRGSAEPFSRPTSPTPSSSSTLGPHREERTIEMMEMSADSQWTGDDLEDEHEHFNEKNSEHNQTTTHTFQEAAETIDSFPPRSGEFPQHNVVHHEEEEEENQHPADLCWSFRTVFEITLCALLLAGSFALGIVAGGAVELSKDD